MMPNNAQNNPEPNANLAEVDVGGFINFHERVDNNERELLNRLQGESQVTFEHVTQLLNASRAMHGLFVFRLTLTGGFEMVLRNGVQYPVNQLNEEFFAEHAEWIGVEEQVLLNRYQAVMQNPQARINIATAINAIANRAPNFAFGQMRRFCAVFDEMNEELGSDGLVEDVAFLDDQQLLIFENQNFLKDVMALHSYFTRYSQAQLQRQSTINALIPLADILGHPNPVWMYNIFHYMHQMNQPNQVGLEN